MTLHPSTSSSSGAAGSRPGSLVLVSDFNLGVLEKFVALHAQGRLAARAAPFGEVMSVLLNDQDALWRPCPQGVFVWTQPHRVLPSVHACFQRCERLDIERLKQDVAAFAAGVKAAARRCGFVLAANWTVPSGDRGWGILEAKARLGFRDIVRRANVMFAEALDDVPGVTILEAGRWIETVGRGRAFDPKLWFAAKMPFTPMVFQEAAKEIVQILTTLRRGARKVLVLDCDNTLWGGIVGEDGWENLRLGGHDPVGEAFKEFQRRIKRLTRQGVILALASKNEEARVWEAFERHPEMVLRREDFAAWRINWNDKAANIASIAEDLNVGLDALVFVDDQPAERGRVAEALAEVLVVDLPADPLLYPAALDGLACFDQVQVSEEDRLRAQSYLQEKQRRRALEAVNDIAVWLAGLDMEMTIEPLTGSNQARVEQLFNKTNQMNLTTRRMSAAEIVRWLACQDDPYGGDGRERGLWAVRVKDRFGDAGLVGVFTLDHEIGQRTMRLTDFILSCRVFGRMVEHGMLATAIEVCRGRGAAVLQAVFRPTPKNKPCLDFLRSSGMEEGPEGTFVWPAARKVYPFPAHIRRRYSEDAAAAGALYPHDAIEVE